MYYELYQKTPNDGYKFKKAYEDYWEFLEEYELITDMKENNKIGDLQYLKLGHGVLFRKKTLLLIGVRFLGDTLQLK